MIAMECALCASPGPHPTVAVKEMMFNRGEFFDYLQCSGCGSLQIVTVPEDLGRFYPASYYAHGDGQRRSIRSRLSALKDRVLLRTGSLAGRNWGSSFFADVLHPLRQRGLKRTSKVLDVGCGTGALLVRLKNAGFTSLHGIDPYAVNVTDQPGIEIRTGVLDDVHDRFDLIVFNHVLEHVRDPVSMLQQALERLTEGGHILVRVPVAGSFASRTQGTKWVQWDAPRHLVVPTSNGLKVGAARAGLTLINTVYDSYYLQFVGSDIYAAAPEAGLIAALRKAGFGKEQLRKWNRTARGLNKAEDGDQAAFVLAKA